MSRPFVFLDRDGTLVVDHGYHFALENYAPLPGAYEAVRLLRAGGFATAIVTNQSGIGRGYFSEADFAHFQAHLLADFAAHGARFEATYHCPHRPDAGCDCRKPLPGMLRRAERELGADLARSWVIGNEESDVGLAGAAGCRAVRVGDAAAPDVLAAAKLVLAQTR